MADDDPKPPAVEDSFYYDPYDEFGPFTEEDLMNIISTPNPTLMDDLSFTETPLPPPPPPPPPSTVTDVFQEHSLGDTNEFLDDHLNLPWELFDPLTYDLNANINNIALGETDHNGNNNVGESRLEMSTRVFGETGVNFETGGPSTMPVPTSNITEGILLCTCCTQLRKIVHGNGNELMKLDIHGGIGYICHAILETQRYGVPNGSRHQTLNLKELDMDGVKRFIEDYCSDREREGLAILQDTNARFYQAMHAWSIKNQLLMSNVASRVDIPMSLVLPNEALNVQPVPLYVGLREEASEIEKKKSPLALQRERAGKMTVKDIGKYFHLPIEEAARRMEVCPTVVKKICRKGGLSRWPHRKIKSIQKKIASLRTMLCTASNSRVKARIEKEIEKLEREINEICSQALKNFQ